MVENEDMLFYRYTFCQSQASTVLPYAEQYLRLILFSAPFIVGSLMLNVQIRQQGNAAYAMVGIMSGAILNMLLDPLLIFTFGMGIRGAGIATLVSQAVSFFVLLLMTERGGNQPLRLRYFSFDRKYIRLILADGTPSLTRQGLGSIATFRLNASAAAYGDYAIVASRLFGHEKGAFTSAEESRKGYFELAEGGTLFLDEIGNLPLDVQAMLLRVLQSKTYSPLGGTKYKVADVRVIAATNENLREAVREGRFRSDLYYRLHEAVIEIPRLSDCKEEMVGVGEVVELCRSHVRQAVFALSYAETELAFHQTVFVEEGTDAVGLLVKKALAFIRKMQEHVAAVYHLHGEVATVSVDDAGAIETKPLVKWTGNAVELVLNEKMRRDDELERMRR